MQIKHSFKHSNTYFCCIWNTGHKGWESLVTEDKVKYNTCASLAPRILIVIAYTISCCFFTSISLLCPWAWKFPPTPTLIFVCYFWSLSWFLRLPLLPFPLCLVHLYMHVYVLSHFSVWLFATPCTVARQALLSMGFSRQEYWSGLPCPAPVDLPNPGIEPLSPLAPAFQADSLSLSDQGSRHYL